jgi:hypothetical protein
MKLFVLARRDLSCSERAVQACHALAELMLRHGADPQVREWASLHRTLILLGVDNEASLLVWEDELRARNISCERFQEPDRRNEATALAVHPSADARLFRRLRLL